MSERPRPNPARARKVDMWWRRCGIRSRCEDSQTHVLETEERFQVEREHEPAAP
jgi:hypothetical protein